MKVWSADINEILTDEDIVWIVPIEIHYRHYIYLCFLVSMLLRWKLVYLCVSPTLRNKPPCRNGTIHANAIHMLQLFIKDILSFKQLCCTFGELFPCLLPDSWPFFLKTIYSAIWYSFEWTRCNFVQGGISQTCHQWQMTVFVISYRYWNPCLWLVISRFVIEKRLCETPPCLWASRHRLENKMETKRGYKVLWVMHF